MLPESFQLGDWIVRPDALEIAGQAGTVTLEAKPMAVLVELARRSGETCSREELLAAVWGDRFVGEEVLTHSIWELRRALGDPAREPRYIRTVPRRGYRLIAAVAPLAPAAAALPDPEVEAEPDLSERTESLSTAPAAEVRSAEKRPVPHPAAFAAALLAAIGLLLLARAEGKRQPAGLRVLALRPALEGPAVAGLDRAATNVLASSLRALLSMEGLVAVSPDYPEGQGAGPHIDAAPVDELLVSTIRSSATGAVLWLRRERLADRSVVWSASFPILLGDTKDPIVAEAVAVHIRRAYAGFPLRPGVAALDVADRDYRRYLEILRERDGMAGDRTAALLTSCEALLATSPRFVEGHLLAAELARSLYTRSRSPGSLRTSLRHVEIARRLAPDDARPLLQQARVLLEAGHGSQAEAALTGLERLTPGEIQIPLLRSRLAQQRGQIEEGIAMMEEAVARFPSWQNLYRLAELEFQAGRIEAARGHLSSLFARLPGSRWGLSLLGRIELFQGDLARGEQAYLELTAGPSPQAPDLVNLGVARFLLGKYPEAVESYRRALAVHPADPSALLNLADAEAARGNGEAAREACGQILGAAPPETESPSDRITRAQCLLYLGRRLEAISLVQGLLRQSESDAQMVYLAALVYARAGDRSSALVNAAKARQLGMQPRWLRIPAFDALRGDPSFRALLRG
jgi:DNA-binding winged helix-turn-helix (wHTH) protein/tetratricopeptide (TPR) repeat protein